MAIYHLSVKAISRSAGRSATAAAAYRAGCKIADARTGNVHDYTRKGGVDHAELILPNSAEWTPTREELWNAAEEAERRKDACVAREHEVALPAELTREQRLALVREYAQDLAERHKCAVDFAIHEPNKDGDQRNHHAHILMTTRVVDKKKLGAKCEREKSGRNRKQDLENERAIWAEMVNTHLLKTNVPVSVDHRSLADQKIDRLPTTHVGPTATEMQRRGIETDRTREPKTNTPEHANDKRTLRNINANLRAAIATLRAATRDFAAAFRADHAADKAAGNLTRRSNLRAIAAAIRRRSDLQKHPHGANPQSTDNTINSGLAPLNRPLKPSERVLEASYEASKANPIKPR